MTHDPIATPDRHTLLDSLAYALKTVLLANLEGLDRSAMETSIDLFMKNEVEPLSDAAILETFYTPADSIQRFLEFLERSGALDEGGDQPVN